MHDEGGEAGEAAAQVVPAAPLHADAPAEVERVQRGAPCRQRIHRPARPSAPAGSFTS